MKIRPKLKHDTRMRLTDACVDSLPLPDACRADIKMRRGKILSASTLDPLVDHSSDLTYKGEAETIVKPAQAGQEQRHGAQVPGGRNAPLSLADGAGQQILHEPGQAPPHDHVRIIQQPAVGDEVAVRAGSISPAGD